jgi:hypothetical protein
LKRCVDGRLITQARKSRHAPASSPGRVGTLRELITQAERLAVIKLLTSGYAV